MNTQIQKNISNTVKHQEDILVIKTNILFPEGAWSGIRKENLDQYYQIITKHQEFLPRYQMEQDESYKQIIPYLVFQYKDQYFLMQRSGTASEKRLQNKFTLGIGGHIRKEDMEGKSIVDWAKREFHEEVIYQDDYEVEPFGIINDETSSVGRVHTGFVFLLRGKTNNIKIRSELKDGFLVNLDECKSYKEKMETWSSTILEEIEKQI